MVLVFLFMALNVNLCNTCNTFGDNNCSKLVKRVDIVLVLLTLLATHLMTLEIMLLPFFKSDANVHKINI